MWPSEFHDFDIVRKFILHPNPHDTEEIGVCSGSIVSLVRPMEVDNFLIDAYLDLLDKQYPDVLIFRLWWWDFYKAKEFPNLDRNLRQKATQKDNPRKPFFRDYERMIWPVIMKLI